MERGKDKRAYYRMIFGKKDLDGMLQYPHGFEPPSPLYQRGHRNGYSARDDLSRVMV